MDDLTKPHLTSSPCSNPESFDVLLDEVKTPVAFKRKLNELIGQGNSESDARRFLKQPIELELIYEPDHGLFAVESEAISSSLGLRSPYSGVQIVEDEN